GSETSATATIAPRGALATHEAACTCPIQPAPTIPTPIDLTAECMAEGATAGPGLSPVPCMTSTSEPHWVSKPSRWTLDILWTGIGHWSGKHPQIIGSPDWRNCTSAAPTARQTLNNYDVRMRSRLI